MGRRLTYIFIGIVGLALYALVIWLSVWWEGWITGYRDSIRDGLLFFTAPVAFLIALWRAYIADRQTRISQETLSNTRYQEISEALVSQDRLLRRETIQHLEQLTLTDSTLRPKVIVRLCTFIRQPPDADSSDGELRADVDAAISALLRIRKKEKRTHLHLDLTGAKLRYADLSGKDISDIVFNDADLSDASLFAANLRGADLRGVDISNAAFAYPGGQAPAKGLTQAQIDLAFWEAGKAPYLEGVTDYDYLDEQLVAKGRGDD